MVTIKDIAREAGVSIGTVDRVIHHRSGVSDQTKTRIEAIMEQLDYKPNLIAQGLAVNKKKMNLCFLIPDASHNPFFEDIHRAAVKKAESLNQKYGVKVTFGKMGAHNYIPFSIEIQNALEEADGIVIPGYDYPGFPEILQRAHKRNVPVVLYNSRNLKTEYMSYVGCDYFLSGRLAAGLTALIGGEGARVGIFSQGMGSVDDLDNVDSYIERIHGFEQEMQERYPEIQIVDYENIAISKKENQNTARNCLQKHPEMNIAYIINPADYDICEAIAQADPKHQVKIITNDLVGQQIRMVQQGIISATICQQPEKQGREPLEILFQYLAYGKKPERKENFTELSIHIAQNAFVQNLQKH